MRVTQHAVDQYIRRIDPDADEITARRKLVRLARRATRHGGYGRGRGYPRNARVIEELDIVIIVIRDSVVTVHRTAETPEYPNDSN